VKIFKQRFLKPLFFKLFFNKIKLMNKVFTNRVLKIVKRIPAGSFLTYRQVAKAAGSPKASRAVGNILAKNFNPTIPCHRIIRSDYLVGGFHGSKNLDYLKAALLLKDGAIGVIPTDTIYGICGSALKKRTVQNIYKLRQRDLKKPLIILINNLEAIKKFKIKLSLNQKKLISKFWPGKYSIILNCSSPEFRYLHRGSNSLAFRVPKNKLIQKILSVSGPLVAPSANLEGKSPARNIFEAKKYFNGKVFYLNRGILNSKPSTIIDLRNGQVSILRR